MNRRFKFWLSPNYLFFFLLWLTHKIQYINLLDPFLPLFLIRIKFQIMCNSPNQKSLLVKTFYDTLLIGKRRQTLKKIFFFFSSTVVSIHVEWLSTTNTEQCCIKNNQNFNFPATVKEKKENSYLPRRQDNNQNLKTRIVRMQVDA